MEELKRAAGRELRAGPAGLAAFLEDVALVAGDQVRQARMFRPRGSQKSSFSSSLG